MVLSSSQSTLCWSLRWVTFDVKGTVCLLDMSLILILIDSCVRNLRWSLCDKRLPVLNGIVTFPKDTVLITVRRVTTSKARVCLLDMSLILILIDLCVRNLRWPLCDKRLLVLNGIVTFPKAVLITVIKRLLVLNRIVLNGIVYCFTGSGCCTV